MVNGQPEGQHSEVLGQIMNPSVVEERGKVFGLDNNVRINMGGEGHSGIICYKKMHLGTRTGLLILPCQERYCR